MTTHNPPRPTSSRPRPTPPDDLPQVTSSLVPLPTGGRGHRSRPRHTPTTPTTSSPGTRSTDDFTNHRNRHLFQAANVAKITGDAPGTLAILLACPRCHP